jgi:trk system potassium uptake protein
MNFRLLSKVLGLLLLLLACTMLVCLAYAVWGVGAAEDDAAGAFGISVLVTALVGGLLLLIGRSAGREILRKEAIAIVGLGWILSTVFGSLPYIFATPGLGVADAFFESASGFTTTGASVMADIESFPRSLLLWRALTQWLGGLGILVLFVALLTYLGVGSKALFRHESSAKSGEGLKTRIHDVALRLWQIYLLFSVVCCAGLVLLGMSFYEALCHAMTAISTGGFSTRNASIAAFDSLAIELWLTLFMCIGGVSFMLMAWLFRRRWERWEKDEETRFYLLLLLIGGIIIAVDLVLMQENMLLGEALRSAFFQVVSIMTTTGYATADFDAWPPFSKVLLLILMFVGGCAGSTSGGIKVSRLVLFFKIVRTEIIAAFRPNQVIAVHINGNQVDEELKVQTLFFLALAAALSGMGTLLIALLEPTLDVTSSFSAVVATLFNIGPGFGMVGPTQNFGGLGSVTKIFLSLFMILGRLEFFAVLVLFVPSLWRKY